MPQVLRCKQTVVGEARHSAGKLALTECRSPRKCPTARIPRLARRESLSTKVGVEKKKSGINFPETTCSFTTTDSCSRIRRVASGSKLYKHDTLDVDKFDETVDYTGELKFTLQLQSVRIIIT